ncbi:MAG: sigma-54-dependent Fis family transcriptional regulator [Pseudobacteriovorax sp.]|nr:sigma-54-dependent Fis family transcriptional regulator [Pseudobacteriovorax sp.]
MTKLHIHHLDDDPFYLEEFAEKLSPELRSRLISHSKANSLIQQLKSGETPGLVILDIQLGQREESGSTMIHQIRQLRPNQTIIMCSDLSDADTVRKCLALGADDFIFKGMDEGGLSERIAAYLHRSEDPAAVSNKREKSASGTSTEDIAARIPNIIDSAITAVHINGESGTGKEYVSDLFENALSKGVPFVRVHCGALTPSLLESELFGHVKGAFTGANAAKVGLIEQANGGWVFLDEVATLTASAQIALLRILENQTVRPVGSTTERSIAVRFISATNEDMSQLVEDGSFRSDLWQRLCEATIDLPPLRERMDEFDQIVDHFCTTMNRGPYKITSGARELLSSYDWRKGNIRELRNCLRAMTEGAVNKILTPATIPSHIWDMLGPSKNNDLPKNEDGIRIPLCEPLSYETMSLRLLFALMKQVTKDTGPQSIRQLSQLIQVPRSTLGTYVKKLVSEEIADQMMIDQIVSR